MNPVALVEVTRGEAVESVHLGWSVVVDRDGRVVEQRGDEVLIFPRSAAKPMQAMPLVRSGAAARLGLDARELALACASHSGLTVHRELALGLLTRAGVGPEALHCGAAYPLDEALAEAMKVRQEAPTPLHHNCSGKHAGMLLRCHDQGWDPAHYEERDHPVQEAIQAVFAEVAGVSQLASGLDGCSVPAWQLPLAGLARAFAVLGHDPEWAPLREAMAAHPELVAGPGRLDTALMQAAPQLVVKSGAEGVHAGVDRARGLAWALKIADGTRRAVAPAVMALLGRHELVTAAQREALAAWETQTLRNARQRVVGTVRPA